MENEKIKVSDNVLVKNYQPLKEVTYHDIYVLKDYLEQLASWKESLCLMKNFFDNQAIPLNKKKIMREFHAQARVFNIFYANFVMSMDTLEKKVEKLGEKEKVNLGK